MTRIPIHELSRPLDHIVIVEKERNVIKGFQKMLGQKAADRFFHLESTDIIGCETPCHPSALTHSASRPASYFGSPVDWEFSWMISPDHQCFFEASRKSARSFWCTVDVERVGCCVGRQMGYLAFGKMVLSRLWSNSWPAFGWICLAMILAN